MLDAACAPAAPLLRGTTFPGHAPFGGLLRRLSTCPSLLIASGFLVLLLLRPVSISFGGLRAISMVSTLPGTSPPRSWTGFSGRSGPGSTRGWTAMSGRGGERRELTRAWVEGLAADIWLEAPRRSGGDSRLLTRWGGLLDRRGVDVGPALGWGDLLRGSSTRISPSRWFRHLPRAKKKDKGEGGRQYAQPFQSIGPSRYGTNMSEYFVTKDERQMPHLLFGTQFMKERTEELVLNASRAGFRGFEIGQSSKAFNERAFAAALKVMLNDDGIERDKLFIQYRVEVDYTKKGKGKDAQAQLDKFIEAALEKLGLDYVDSVILADPGTSHEETMVAWRALEDIAEAGLANTLGIANIDVDSFDQIWKESKVRPRLVQGSMTVANRFQRPMRTYCINNGCNFQPVNALKDNEDIVNRKIVRQYADAYQTTSRTLFQRFMMGLFLMPITGPFEDVNIEEEAASWRILLEGQDAWNINCILIDLMDPNKDDLDDDE